MNLYPNNSFTGRAPENIDYGRAVGRAPMQWLFGDVDRGISAYLALFGVTCIETICQCPCFLT